jgi:dTDP-4-amino-4,6-dideoxygalactose transaminase
MLNKIIPFVDLYRQYLSIQNEVDDAVREIIRESAFIRSKHVDDFEKSFEALLGRAHVVSCANGTDALYILMKGLKVGPGSEVITSAHSWISTSETITQAGGSVVFADTDPNTFTISPQDIERKITSRTVGIIPVHLYGHPADMHTISAIAKKHGLWVIEDCAQAHLAKINGKMVGTFGDGAGFSFYPGKNLGAMGDAGALVAKSEGLAEWCKLFARHGGKGVHTIEGINSRLDGIQAAVLNVKIPHLKRWTKKRQVIAEIYNSGFAGIPEVQTPLVLDGYEHVYHLYVIKCQDRDKLRQHLKTEGIETSINYPRMLPFYPAYARLGHKPDDFPCASSYEGLILSLPLFPEITDSEINRVIDSVRGFYRA